MRTILAITGDPVLPRKLRGELQIGYRVVSADDEQVALTMIHHERPDLVLVDLARQDLDGLKICQRLRQADDVPILALTACIEQAEWMVTQEGGADNFILKPCSPLQILARIQALLHWAERRGGASHDAIQVGDLVLNLAHHRVTVAGKPVDLTRTELELLAALAAEPDQAFTRSQLLGALEADDGTSKRTIDSHIKNLRAKIELDPCHPRYLLTVYGVGYKLSSQHVRRR